MPPIYNLVLLIAQFFVLLPSNIYLLMLAFQLQKLFRQHGYLQGYKGEFLVSIVFPLYVIAMINVWVVQPIITFLVYKTDFSCSEDLIFIIWVLQYISSLMWPGALQAIFIGLMWQLSRM